MASIVVLYQNYADTAALSGGSWVASLALTNLQDDDVGVYAETTDALTASTQLVANLGASRTVGGIAFGPCNASPGATYRFRGYSDAALTTPVDGSDSGIKTIAGATIDWSDEGDWLEWEDPGFWLGLPDSSDGLDLPLWLAHIFPEDVEVQYWKIEVFDTGNADGRFRASRLLISRAWRPSINYNFENEFVSNNPVTLEHTAVGGKKTVFTLAKARSLRVAFTYLDDAELFGDVFRIGNRVGTEKQVFIVPDPDDDENFQKRSFLARMRAAPPIVQAILNAGTTAIDCEEVI